MSIATKLRESRFHSLSVDGIGDFVVFGWDPVEISLSIRFEGKSRVYEDENNTIEQPDACSMDAISRKDLSWYGLGARRFCCFWLGSRGDFAFNPL